MLALEGFLLWLENGGVNLASARRRRWAGLGWAGLGAEVGRMNSRKRERMYPGVQPAAWSEPDWPGLAMGR